MADHSTTGRRKSDRAGAIARFSPRTGALSWISLTGLVLCFGLLAVGGIIYYKYVDHRETFLAKEAFRSLEELSRNVSNATRGYVKLLEPFALQADGLARLTKKNLRETDLYASAENSRCFSHSPVSFSDELWNLNNTEELKSITKHFEFVLSALCSANKLADVWLSFDSPTLQPFPIRSSPLIKESEAIRLALSEGYRFDSIKENALQFAAPARPKPTTYRIISETDAAKSLRLELKQEIASKDLNIASKNEWTSVTVSARFRLDVLIQELAIPEAFTDVIIADEAGQVILQRSDPDGVATARFERLDILLSHSSQGAESFNSTSASLSTATASSNSLPLSRLPVQKSIQIGENNYFVFAQALTLDLRESASVKQSPDTQPLKLIIAGLVPVNEFHWAARKIPHGMVLGLIFSAFVLVFALPLIKLLSMGPRDRLGLPDALVSMFFSIMGTALFTLALGAWITHTTINDSADNQLEKGSTAIKGQFKNELTTVVSQLNMLRGYEGKAATLCPENGPLKPKMWNSTNYVLSPRSGCRKGSGLQVKGPVINDPFLVHMALWVGPDGEVNRLEAVQQAPIVTTNLNERPYLRDMWNGTNLHRLSENSFEFSIQPVLAWNDGEFATMIAAKAITLPKDIPDLNHQAFKDYKDYVVAIRAPLRALTQTVLPIGYGYSVIDKTGLVLYDLDKRNNLRENLFKATDDNQELKSIVSSGATAKVRASYHGHSYVMYVAPLMEDVLPWTLVVYRDTQWLDWVTDESLFFAVALFSMYALVFIVIGLFVSVLYTSIASGSGGWMWPANAQWNEYRFLSLVNIAGITLLLWWIWIWIDKGPLFAMFSAMAGVCILTGLIIYALKRKVPKTRTASPQISQDCQPPNALSPHVRWAYSSMATTTIFVLAVIPSNTFLSIGAHRSLSLYESYAGHSITERVNSCKRAFEVWKQRVLTAKQRDYFKEHSDGCWKPLLSEEVPPNITDGSVTWLNEKYRSRLHLWMGEPGKQLGGWIGHAPTNNPVSFSSSLYEPKRAGELHIYASILAIVVVLAYARLFEQGSARLLVAILAVLVTAFLTAGSLIVRTEIIYHPEPPSAWWHIDPFLTSMILGTGIVTAITYCTQRIVGHYLFLLDFQEPIILNGPSTRTSHKHILIVIPTTHESAWIGEPLKVIVNDSSSIGWHVYDIPQHIQNTEVEWGAAECLPLPKNNGALAVVGFDFRVTEPRQAHTMLEFMERLALEPDRPVLLIAQCHPFDSELMSFESTEVSGQGRTADVKLERWAHALRDFLIIPFSGRECQGDQKDIIKEILDDPGYLTGEDWAHFVNEVKNDQDQDNYSRMRYALGMMRCRYEYWWADCTKSERLALAQIASDHFLHAGNPKLYPLIWKGFVKLQPHIQLRSQSFRTFILQVADRDGIHQLEYDLKPSIWAKASGPLVIGLISFVLFLGITQESVRDVIIAFAPILPAFILELPKLFGGWGRSSIPRIE